MNLLEAIEELKESLKTHDTKLKDEHILTVLDAMTLWRDLSYKTDESPEREPLFI
jgi:hypothetical protein